jgi:hypothetical protein
MNSGHDSSIIEIAEEENIQGEYDMMFLNKKNIAESSYDIIERTVISGRCTEVL